jgi:hypothetical protein
MSTHPNPQAGRRWAYAGAILGGVVSVAANVAHSYVPPVGSPADWSPEPGAVIGAVFWPVAVLVAVEILARVAWPSGRRWVAVRYLGLLPVGLVAAVVSYRHLSGLLAHYGEDALTVTIGPLAVDGLMVMATAALLATGHRTALTAEVTAGPDLTADRPVDTVLTAVNDTVEVVDGPPVAAGQPVSWTAAVSGAETAAELGVDRTEGDGPTATVRAVRPAVSVRSARRSGPVAGKRSAGRSKAVSRPRPDVSDLLPVGRSIAAELDRSGRSLSRSNLVAEFRTRGQSVSTDRAGELVRRLRDEPRLSAVNDG